MKKILATILVLSMFLVCSFAVAEDLGVQIIGGNEATFEAMSLEDVKLEQTYEIPGFAKITPVSFAYLDYFPQYDKGANGNNETFSDGYTHEDRIYSRNFRYYYSHIYFVNSGNNADFACLSMDIVNLQKTPYAFMKNATVKVVVGDDYEFAGWMRQFNYDYDFYREVEGTSTEEYGKFIRAAIVPDSEEDIGMLYTGHYYFGCTLPNDVINNSNMPIQMVITIGDSEIIYNIRK